MAKISTGSAIVSIPKKTAQGNNKSMLKRSSMNKHKKRSTKPYRGQGK